MKKLKFNKSKLKQLQKVISIDKKVQKSDKNIQRVFSFSKIDEDERVVGGIIYAPNTIDAQNDWTTPEEITKAMYGFMENSLMVKVMHGGPQRNISILECFQAEEDTRKGDNVVPAGSWWMSFRVNEDEIWNGIKAGTYTGFSFSGLAKEV